MDEPQHGAYSRYESLGQAAHPVSGDSLFLGFGLNLNQSGAAQVSWKSQMA